MTTPSANSDTLAGRTIVVTGASDGIGRAAVRAWAVAGANVIMVGRSEAKTAAAARSIMSETGSRNITWDVADLSRQEAVHELADRLHSRLSGIDVLVNNAGAVFMERKLTAEGLERTFALNHLAYFSLTLRLLDLLRAASVDKPTRVICVASRAHRDARLDIDDLQSARQYRGWRAYANSKLENLLFTRALSRRIPKEHVVVHALHPGVVSTRFAVNNGRRGRVLRRIMDVVSISPEQGADTLVWLAFAPDALTTTGDYWVKRARIEPSARALDDVLAEQLWNASQELSGIDTTSVLAE